MEIALDSEMGPQREGDLLSRSLVALGRGMEAVGEEVGAVGEAGVAGDDLVTDLDKAWLRATARVTSQSAVAR